MIGIGALISKGLGLASEVYTSDSERLELSNEKGRAEQEYKLDNKRLDVGLKTAHIRDTANARKANEKIQESENASWLAKNSIYIMAFVIISLTFYLYFWVISSGGEVLTKNESMKDIIIYILGALTTIAVQVVGWMFGSSQSSKDKTDALTKATKSI